MVVDVPDGKGNEVHNKDQEWPIGDVDEPFSFTVGLAVVRWFTPRH